MAFLSFYRFYRNAVSGVTKHVILEFDFHNNLVYFVRSVDLYEICLEIANLYPLPGQLHIKQKSFLSRLQETCVRIRDSDLGIISAHHQKTEAATERNGKSCIHEASLFFVP